jgi:hypothetical protein
LKRADAAAPSTKPAVADPTNTVTVAEATTTVRMALLVVSAMYMVAPSAESAMPDGLLKRATVPAPLTKPAAAATGPVNTVTAAPLTASSSSRPKPTDSAMTRWLLWSTT